MTPPPMLCMQIFGYFPNLTSEGVNPKPDKEYDLRQDFTAFLGFYMWASSIAQSKLELYKGDFPSEAQNVSMAICVCVLKSEQKEREFCPTLFHSTYSTQSPHNLSQNKEEKNKTCTYRAHSRP